MLRRILIHDDITQHWTDCWVMIWYVLSVGNVGRTVVVVTLISVSSIGHSLNETSRTFWRGMVAKFKKLKNKYPNRNIRIIFFHNQYLISWRGWCMQCQLLTFRWLWNQTYSRRIWQWTLPVFLTWWSRCLQCKEGAPWIHLCLIFPSYPPFPGHLYSSSAYKINSSFFYSEHIMHFNTWQAHT